MRNTGAARPGGQNALRNRGEGRQSAGICSRAIVWRKGVEQKREIVDQCVVSSKSGADRCLSFSERIPRQSHPGAEQAPGVIFRIDGIPDERIGNKQTLSVGDVVGSPAVRLIPAGRELVPNAGADRQVASKAYRVFGVPRPEQTSPSQFGCGGHYLEVAGGSLQKGGQTRKSRLPEPARGDVFVVLHALKPDAETDLVSPTADLQSVCICEEISAISRSGRIVRACRSYSCRARAGSGASDNDSSRPGPGHKVGTCGKCRERKRIKTKCRTRESGTGYIDDPRGEDMRVPDARHLSPQRRKRTE